MPGKPQVSLRDVLQKPFGSVTAGSKMESRWIRAFMKDDGVVSVLAGDGNSSPGICFKTVLRHGLVYVRAIVDIANIK
jgi:hypothetical protein